jgi:drug/metabolite transporter (DMT)-like permease
MEDMARSGALVFVFLIVFGIFLIPFIFYLLTLQKAIERCDPQSRTTTPGSVWLLLIPLFNIVYQFIVVSNISQSLANEFARRGITNVEREPGKTLGIAMCILNITGIIPIIGIVLALGGLVCWILYWVKISNYSNQIALPLPAAPSYPQIPS